MTGKVILLLLLSALALYGALLGLVFFRQRSLLYFPTHHQRLGALRPWSEHGEQLGFAREVQQPATVWLMAHGNAGQASDREYVLNTLPADASLYVVEYPGYGFRSGKPTMATMNQAVADAYARLVERFPNVSIGLIGESIGSGPVCALAQTAPIPLRKIVLVVPFDTLASVASDRLSWLPVGWLLRDRWDNVTALRSFRGQVEIYGARFDGVIPVKHAQHLAEATGAKLVLLDGGHNDWSSSGVKIR